MGSTEHPDAASPAPAARGGPGRCSPRLGTHLRPLPLRSPAPRARFAHGQAGAAPAAASSRQRDVPAGTRRFPARPAPLRASPAATAAPGPAKEGAAPATQRRRLRQLQLQPQPHPRPPPPPLGSPLPAAAPAAPSLPPGLSPTPPRRPRLRRPLNGQVGAGQGACAAAGPPAEGGGGGSATPGHPPLHPTPRHPEPPQHRGCPRPGLPRRSHPARCHQPGGFLLGGDESFSARNVRSEGRGKKNHDKKTTTTTKPAFFPPPLPPFCWRIGSAMNSCLVLFGSANPFITCNCLDCMQMDSMLWEACDLAPGHYSW